MLIALWGCSLLSLHLLSALKIKSLKLYKHEVEAQPGGRLLILCRFEMFHAFNPSELKIEWSEINDQNGLYTPVIEVLDSLVVPLPEPNYFNERAQMFLSLLPKGNCSLVINPTFKNDSGTYKVKLFLSGQQYHRSPSVHVRVIKKGSDEGSVNAGNFSTPERSEDHWKLRNETDDGKTTSKSRKTQDIEPSSEADESDNLPDAIQGQSSGAEESGEGPGNLSYEGSSPDVEDSVDMTKAITKHKTHSSTTETTKYKTLHINQTSLPKSDSQPTGKVETKGQATQQGQRKKEQASKEEGSHSNDSMCDPELAKIVHEMSQFQKKVKIPITSLVYIALAMVIVLFIGCMIGCIHCKIYIIKKCIKNQEES